MLPQRREARRGPGCSCCRAVPAPRVQVVVGNERNADPDYTVAVCPTCDCVEPPAGYRPGAGYAERRVTGALVPIWRGNLR